MHAQPNRMCFTQKMNVCLIYYLVYVCVSSCIYILPVTCLGYYVQLPIFMCLNVCWANTAGIALANSFYAVYKCSKILSVWDV